MNNYYQNSIQHILDELTRIDLLLHVQVLKFRSQHKSTNAPNEFQVLFISEQEVNELIAGKPLGSEWFQQSDSDNPDFKPFINKSPIFKLSYLWPFLTVFFLFQPKSNDFTIRTS